jgi:INO80 complex subunit C
MHIPKPFKNPLYTKNNTRRTQTLKTLLSREKERDKAVRAERSERAKGKVNENGKEATSEPKEVEIREQDLDGEDRMDLDPQEKRPTYFDFILEEDEIAEGFDPNDIPSCKRDFSGFAYAPIDSRTIDFSIESPPSFLPMKRYCDITGLEVNLHSILVHGPHPFGLGPI